MRQSSEFADEHGQINFLLLAAELRLRIYEYALGPSSESTMHEVFINEKHIKEHPKRHLQPAITMINRHIRKEALPVFYGTSMFIAPFFFGGRLDGVKTVMRSRCCHVAFKWLKAIGDENVKMIKHVKFYHTCKGGFTRNPKQQVLEHLKDGGVHLSEDAVQIATGLDGEGGAILIAT